MSWVLFVIFYAAQGGVAAQKIEFQTRDLCMKAAERLSHVNSVGGELFCFQVKK